MKYILNRSKIYGKLTHVLEFRMNFKSVINIETLILSVIMWNLN